MKRWAYRFDTRTRPQRVFHYSGRDNRLSQAMDYALTIEPKNLTVKFLNLTVKFRRRANKLWNLTVKFLNLTVRFERGAETGRTLRAVRPG